jgi:hypothetical protein
MARMPRPDESASPHDCRRGSHLLSSSTWPAFAQIGSYGTGQAGSCAMTKAAPQLDLVDGRFRRFPHRRVFGNRSALAAPDQAWLSWGTVPPRLNGGGGTVIKHKPFTWFCPSGRSSCSGVWKETHGLHAYHVRARPLLGSKPPSGCPNEINCNLTPGCSSCKPPRAGAVVRACVFSRPAQNPLVEESPVQTALMQRRGQTSGDKVAGSTSQVIDVPCEELRHGGSHRDPTLPVAEPNVCALRDFVPHHTLAV